MTPEERANKLQCYGGGGGITFVSKADAADAIRAAVLAEREACRIAQCFDCADGIAYIDEGEQRGKHYHMDGNLNHIYFRCEAEAIRVRTAQEEGG